MPANDDWIGDQRRLLEKRREILERRTRERLEAEAAQGKQDRRAKKERRKEQICFTCHSSFTPKVSGQVICPDCQLRGVRGATDTGGRSIF